MTLRLSDLSRNQRRVLVRLDDGLPHEDSVGVQLHEIPVPLFEAFRSLRTLGLVETSIGWQHVVWVRLTEAGRRIREVGDAG